MRGDPVYDSAGEKIGHVEELYLDNDTRLDRGVSLLPNMAGFYALRRDGQLWYYDVGIQGVRCAGRIGDRTEIRPRTVELPRVGREFVGVVGAQQHVGIVGTAVAELVGRERISREQRVSRG